MLKRIILTLLLCFALLPGIVAAQDIDSLLAILESHRNDEEWLAILSGEANYHLLYFQIGYESDSYFAGRDIGLEQANLTAQASYSYKQFSLSTAAIIYPQLYPPLQATALSVNYRIPLKFPINIDINYGRYFFNSENDTLSSIYPNGFGLGLSHHAKFWGVSTDMSLLTGSEGLAPQIDASIYGNFKIFSWKKDNYISVRPEIGIYFGSETTARARVPRGLAKITGPGDGLGNGNGNDQGGGSGSGQEIVYSTAFGLLNTSMNIHLLATLGDFDVGITIQNNRPRSVEAEIAYAPTSMVSVTAGYAFSIIGK
ncbi:MAG: hypothetical protein KAU44_05400 [Candidatus Marinimicrobia bacterium]|nr:hypothetical protein [Candidatus Neomarinimicrobiota bacterium]